MHVKDGTHVVPSNHYEGRFLEAAFVLAVSCQMKKGYNGLLNSVFSTAFTYGELSLIDRLSSTDEGTHKFSIHLSTFGF